MSGQPEEESGPGGPGESEAARRRRRALVFGEVLPEATRDDQVDAWADGSGERQRTAEDSDEWLRGQVPPHHGS